MRLTPANYAASWVGARAYSFDDAIASVVAWYVDNRPWPMRSGSGEYRDYYRAQYAVRSAALAGAAPQP
jgi:dTDP-D-glucose 4,6-dehydratase